MIEKIALTRSRATGIDTITIDHIDSFAFSGGEVHIQLPEFDGGGVERVVVTTRIEQSYDAMELFMATDAIRRRVGRHVPIQVIIPYLPYARQDKLSAPGESLSLRVFADLLNTQGYAQIVTYDAHSDVSLALINNLKSISQASILHYLATVSEECREHLINKVLVSPDAGAAKKVYALHGVLSPKEIIPADKQRSRDGEIIGTNVYCDDFKGEEVAIIDDIIDGGRTFIELAKVLKSRNCGEINLFATHGILSKGCEPLLNAGIARIFITDTFKFTPPPGGVMPSISNIVGNIL